MKLKFIIFFIFILCSCLPKKERAKLKTGFRSYSFGQDSALFKNKLFIRKSDEGLVDVYSVENDTLSLGSSNLQSIEYYFYKGSFYKVELTSLQLDGFAMKSVFTDIYGEGEESKYGESYRWSDFYTSVNYSEDDDYKSKVEICNNKTDVEVWYKVDSIRKSKQGGL